MGGGGLYETLPTPCYWVGNGRIICFHLLFKHRMDRKRANAELMLYYAMDEESE
jgi:hypothetical protein